MSDAAYLSAGIREMQASDLQGGTATIGTASYACTVGTFSKMDVFRPDGGGITPKMMGDIQLLLEDLPPTLNLQVGLKITVTPNTGKVRSCQVHSTQNSGNYVSVLLWDANENA